MNLEIFDVAHGACALLTCSNGQRLMIDCGHNTETGWQPGTHLRKQGITYLDALAITNYDEDHVSGLPNLLENVRVGTLFRNMSLRPETLKTIKAKNGIGPGIDALIRMASDYTKLIYFNQDSFPGVDKKVFYNHYPLFTDTNNLSMVIQLTINNVKFLFTGDLEHAGWEALLQQYNFQTAVRGTHVYIASHHGRESGIYNDVFDKYFCKPYYVVISDKGHMHETQKTMDYYFTKALGGPFRNQRDRKVLTTRKDGKIIFVFKNTGWEVL